MVNNDVTDATAGLRALGGSLPDAIDAAICRRASEVIDALRAALVEGEERQVRWMGEANEAWAEVHRLRAEVEREDITDEQLRAAAEQVYTDQRQRFYPLNFGSSTPIAPRPQRKGTVAPSP